MSVRASSLISINSLGHLQRVGSKVFCTFLDPCHCPFFPFLLGQGGSMVLPCLLEVARAADFDFSQWFARITFPCYFLYPFYAMFEDHEPMWRPALRRNRDPVLCQEDVMQEREYSYVGVPDVENFLATTLRHGVWPIVGGCLDHFLYGPRYLDYSKCLHVIDTAAESCAPRGMQERVSD